MRILSVILLLAVEVLPAPPSSMRFADFPPARGEQSVLILRVIDGDTVEGAFLVKARFRIDGISAAELRAEGGPEARAALEAIVPPGSIQRADLRGHEKYGRALADFQTDSGLASKRMLELGHAKPWNGKGKKP